MIVKAAIKVQKYIIVSLPSPARHADIIQHWHIKWDMEQEEGFLDEHDHFLTRTEALIEARRCNQPLIDFWNDLDTTTELYTENLW